MCDGLEQLAETLSLDKAKTLLVQTLDEEKQADEMLSEIVKCKFNYGAANEEDQ